jgi:hypothetical protein
LRCATATFQYRGKSGAVFDKRKHYAMRSSALAIVAALVAATPMTANAASTGFAPNYTFPDGIHGFALEGYLPAVQNVLVNPGVLVGFNPQPDPPGAPLTELFLGNAMHPELLNLAPLSGFRFIMSLVLPSGSCDSSIPMPNSDGMTGFHCTEMAGGETANVDVALQFSGPGGVVDWVSFNPQPDPPGDVNSYDLTFAGVDAAVAFSVSVNGQPVDFRLVPEPSTLGLLGVGLIGLGSFHRWRRDHGAATA